MRGQQQAVAFTSIGLGETVRDGVEAETVTATHSTGALSVLHAVVVVLGVDGGDVDVVVGGAALRAGAPG